MSVAVPNAHSLCLCSPSAQKPTVCYGDYKTIKYKIFLHNMGTAVLKLECTDIALYVDEHVTRHISSLLTKNALYATWSLRHSECLLIILFYTHLLARSLAPSMLQSSVSFQEI